MEPPQFCTSLILFIYLSLIFFKRTTWFFYLSPDSPSFTFERSASLLPSKQLPSPSFLSLSTPFLSQFTLVSLLFSLGSNADLARPSLLISAKQTLQTPTNLRVPDSNSKMLNPQLNSSELPLVQTRSSNIWYFIFRPQIGLQICFRFWFCMRYLFVFSSLFIYFL